MIIPVRCFSCGKVSDRAPNRPFVPTATKRTNNSREQVVGDLWTKYIKLIEIQPDGSEGMAEGYVLSHPKNRKTNLQWMRGNWNWRAFTDLRMLLLLTEKR
jgi:DNA-directed RNA polymerase subunit N (RpoN/RPB10)